MKWTERTDLNWLPQVSDQEKTTSLTFVLVDTGWLGYCDRQTQNFHSLSQRVHISVEHLQTFTNLKFWIKSSFFTCFMPEYPIPCIVSSSSPLYMWRIWDLVTKWLDFTINKWYNWDYNPKLLHMISYGLLLLHTTCLGRRCWGVFIPSLLPLLVRSVFQQRKVKKSLENGLSHVFPQNDLSCSFSLSTVGGGECIAMYCVFASIYLP